MTLRSCRKFSVGKMHPFVVACWMFSLIVWVECYSAVNTRSIRFPFLNSHECESSWLYDSDYLLKSFDHVVDSTSYFVKSSVSGECTVPALGNARVSFQAISPAEYELSVEGGSEEDFGWICTRFFEYRSGLSGVVDTDHLEKVALEHSLRHQRESVGDDPALARLANSSVIQQIFSSQPNVLQNLQRNGFVIIDSPTLTNQLAQNTDLNQLTQLLVKKSSQSSSIRNDKVAFISRQEATSCGLEFQFDVLMAIASHLNDHFDLTSWPFPHSTSTKLKNPKMVQVAEYGNNDFYVAHKDNSYNHDVSRDSSRSNNRYCTCILYCNHEHWDATDGGALRLYPGSHHYSCEEAMQKILPIDILPTHGRLVLFDCMLVHSVQKVTHPTKKRRAITVWINRPDQEQEQTTANSQHYTDRPLSSNTYLVAER